MKMRILRANCELQWYKLSEFQNNTEQPIVLEFYDEDDVYEVEQLNL
jgi:hypothetical protein